MKKELLKGLSEGQIAKFESCKSQEEILKLAKEEGVELSDEQLAAVNGGGCGEGQVNESNKCPKCGSKDIEPAESGLLKCNKCGHVWKATVTITR